MPQFKSIGLPDLIQGLWDYNKAKKTFEDGDITEESLISKKRFHLVKSGYGAVKLAILGFAAAHIAEPIIYKSNINSIDIGLLATFGATYALVGFSNFNSNILKDEALGYKHLQSKILENSLFFEKKLNFPALPVEESYQLFMFGNKLKTGNPVDEFMFNIKSKVIDWQANLTVNDNLELGIIKKHLYKILKSRKIDSILDNISKKTALKQEAYSILKQHSDPHSSVNNEFKKYIRTYNIDIIQEDDEIKKELKDINQKSIFKAYEMTRIQNVQLFFARIIIDYNEGNIHTNIIEQFRNLKQQNTIKSKNIITVPEYDVISKIAQNMLEGKDLSKKYNDPLSIIKDLNPNMIDKNKGVLKTISFNEAFVYQKRKLLNNFNNTNKFNANIYMDKKVNFNDIEYDLESFKDILKIKKDAEFKKSSIQNNNGKNKIDI